MILSRSSGVHPLLSSSANTAYMLFDSTPETDGASALPARTIEFGRETSLGRDSDCRPRLGPATGVVAVI